jgi:hypothetical protein
MIQTSRTKRWRRTARAFPSVQSDVMVVTASGKKRRLPTKTLRQFEAEYIAIKYQRTFKFSHFEMHVADLNTWINRRNVLRHDFL